MTSLGQSVAHLTFTHSQIYTNSFQPTIEILLKATKKPQNSSDEKKTLKNNQSFEEPLVIFDHDYRKVRKTSSKDGLFYYLCTRPSVLHEARNREFLRPRKLRFLICITMSSQSRDEYENTIFGIYENLKAFKSIGICNEDIAVIAIIDGCLKMDPSMKEFFKQEDKLRGIDEKKSLYFRSKVYESPHRYPEFSDYPRDSLYMYQLSVRPQGVEKESKDNYLNVFLCTKLEATGKLGSHLWFFRGFCEMFNPEYCCLIEAGTKTSSTALFEFFKAMETDRQIGGVCGYISLFTEPTVDEFGTRIDEDSYKNLDMISKLSFQFFDLQKAQVLEYAFDHILDKSCESFFGFSHVLPSVFSAYRWDALKGDQKKSLMDDIYLRTLVDPNYVYSKDFTLEQANMHLAEDRILSLEIFSRGNFIVKYIPDAICWTSAAKYLLKLMEQRRISLNSSWFAMNYLTAVCWKKVLESEHTAIRIVSFYTLMAYSTINLLLYYFSISLYCIILHLISTEFFSHYFYVGQTTTNTTGSVSGTIMFIYLIFVGSMLFCSLIYKSKEGIGQFQMATTGLGLFNLFIIGYLAYLIVSLLILKSDSILNKTVIYTNEIDRTWDFTVILPISNIMSLQILGIITCSCYLVPMILNPMKSCVDILFSIKDFLFYFPMYIHTLPIYAFCNIDDLSGGTKVLKTNPELVKKSNKYKIQYVYRWLSLNMLLTYIMIIVNTDPVYKNWFILIISLIFTGNLAFKAIFATLNHLKYYFFEKHYYNYCIKERFNEYKARSDELMKYIENTKKTLTQSAMNFSAVSIQYEDNTMNNRYIKPDKVEVKPDMQALGKSNLGIVFEEEESKGSNSNGDSSHPEDLLQIAYTNSNQNINNNNNNNNQGNPHSPKKPVKKSIFAQKFNNNFGTNTKQSKEEAKLNNSGKYTLITDKMNLIANEPTDSIDFDTNNQSKNLDIAFDKKKEKNENRI